MKEEKQVDIFKELTLDEMLLIAGGGKIPQPAEIDPKMGGMG